MNGVEQIFKVSHLIILEMFPKISFFFTVEENYHYIHAAILMHDTGVLSFYLVFVLFLINPVSSDVKYQNKTLSVIPSKGDRF